MLDMTNRIELYLSELLSSALAIVSIILIVIFFYY